LNLFTFQYPFFFFLPSCWSDLDHPSFAFMSHHPHHHHCHHHYHHDDQDHFRSTFHKWANPCNIWLIELDLYLLTWWSPVPSNFPKDDILLSYIIQGLLKTIEFYNLRGKYYGMLKYISTKLLQFIKNINPMGCWWLVSVILATQM
jgi:hypothetical protein